jgi:hypothetical protein
LQEIFCLLNINFAHLLICDKMVGIPWKLSMSAVKLGS